MAPKQPNSRRIDISYAVDRMGYDIVLERVKDGVLNGEREFLPAEVASNLNLVPNGIYVFLNTLLDMMDVSLREALFIMSNGSDPSKAEEYVRSKEVDDTFNSLKKEVKSSHGNNKQ